ncbi:MAG: hypothetical protein RLZZ241_975 [Bacteroidota bacterium]|jgi:nucleotide-binding universal stress UspA family protein
MKTIVIPTDFSRNAWNALFTALKLFDREACEIVLFHAYQPNSGTALKDATSKPLWEVYEELKHKAQEEMMQIETYFEKEYHNPHHRFRSLCIQGDLIVALESFRNTTPIDLIVMGTQGATGAKRVFLGSNTVRILKQIKKVPVLAVPAVYVLQRLARVVLPTDYSHEFTENTLRLLLELMRKWKSRIDLLYVANEPVVKPEQLMHRKQAEQLFLGLDYRMKQIPGDRKISDVISGYAESVRADLVVLIRHKHSFIAQLTREPVVKHLGYRSTAVLLVLPQFD